MNELETQNLHDDVIRKSVVVLLFKGGIAWALLALMDYGFDQLPNIFPNPISLNSTTLIASEPVFHLILNILFGWLMLYVVLAWVFEYYIIKNDSIVVRRGIIFSHEDVYQMEDVKTINTYEGFWDKIFKIGTVSFYAHGAQKHVYLSGIDNPSLIAAHIYKIHPGPETVLFAPSTSNNSR